MQTDRLHGSINLKTMIAAHIVVVGIGGASGLIEDLARCGVGKITAIDFDTVDATNLCTQGYSQKDIGKPKVEALGAHIQSIRPDIDYRSVTADLLDIPEAEIDRIMSEADLLLFMTDNFYAQARGNLIALKLKKPALFAIVYEKARCAEITFTIPGKTPACHRCATSPRYDAYQSGYKNDVKSVGSNIVQTHYLNASLGLLCLAILHLGDTTCEFGRWFSDESIFRRNLIQIRMSPMYGSDLGDETIFDKTFKGLDRTYALDSIWHRVTPEKPPEYALCPDCGGEGVFQTVAGDMSTTPRM